MFRLKSVKEVAEIQRKITEYEYTMAFLWSCIHIKDFMSVSHLRVCEDRYSSEIGRFLYWLYKHHANIFDEYGSELSKQGHIQLGYDSDEE